MSPNASVLVLLIAASVMPGAQSDYEKQILAERHQEAKMQDRESPIYVIGRYAIDEGRTTLVSARAAQLPCHGARQAFWGPL